MSIFVTLLAYEDEILITNSKIAILAASLIAGIIGFFLLKLTLPSTISEKETEEI